MIPALIPPQAPLDQLVHGSAPVAPAHRVADGDVVYGICTVGEAGRILDHHLFAALGWAPGTRLHIDVTDDALLVGQLLDGPVHVQYLRWIGAVLQGDFGVPFQSPTETVVGLIQRAWPVTLVIGVLVLSIIVVGVFYLLPQPKADVDDESDHDGSVAGGGPVSLANGGFPTPPLDLVVPPTPRSLQKTSVTAGAPTRTDQES